MRFLIVIILFLGWITPSYGQISFYKIFSNNGVDIGHGAVQLEDSSYVITGSSSSFFNGPSQIFLMKLDSSGTYKWSKDFGGPESDVGRRVLYKKNVGYFVCGYSNSSGNGDYDMYVAKIDENVQFEWEKFYGGDGWERVNDAALTKDTGLLMVGETSSGNSNSDIYIVRTDINGDTLWTKQIGGLGDDVAHSITQHNDSMFVVGGQIWNEDSLMSKGYVFYLKDDGTIIWDFTTGANGDYWINDVTIDGTRIAAIGGTSGVNKDGIDFYFCPIDFGGGAMGPYEQPAADDENFMHIAKYGDGTSFYIVAHREGAGFYEGGPDVTISSFLTNMLWQNGVQIGHTLPDIAGDIIPTNDGGALIVGYTTEVVSGGNEVFVVKVGPNEMYPDPVGDVEYHDLVGITVLQLEESVVDVYPNPTQSSFTIRGEDEWYKIRVVSLSGTLLLNDTFFGKNTYSTELLESGTYILDLTDDSGNRQRCTLVVQK